jgi:phage N-6-adenine-methyltransferase
MQREQPQATRPRLKTAPLATTAPSVHFSSKSGLWETPPGFFQRLDREFGFTLDACALPANAKCRHFYTPTDDGLAQEWKGVVWMNPPYGREISRWVEKAYRASQQGTTVVCLLPARTDTAWWHTYVMQAHEIRFVRGRLKFSNAAHSAPFPSAVVVFRPADGTRGKGSTSRISVLSAEPRVDSSLASVERCAVATAHRRIQRR